MRLTDVGDDAFVWTALPPLPLRGLGSELVEPFDFYLLRLSWTTGISLQQIVGLLAKRVGKGGRDQRLSCYRTDNNFEALVFSLEQLTGISHLRHGTFWALKNIVKERSMVGWGAFNRRWCPLCYQQWDPEEDWEPLVWSIPYVHRCSRHGCSLISNCPSCGAKQPSNTRLNARHKCRSCKAALSGNGTFADQPKLFDWVDKQVRSLVKFCATPGREALPRGVLSELMSGFKSKSDEVMYLKNTVPSFTWLYARSDSMLLSLKELINLAALHGVPIVDLVTRPKEAAAKPLLDLWRGFHCIYDPFVESLDPVKRAGWVGRRLLKRGSSLYIPAIRVLAKDAGVALVRLKDFDPQFYASYVEAYQDQAGPTARYIKEKAFLAARKNMEGLDHLNLEGRIFWGASCDLRREVNISEADASRIFRSALIYSRLLAMALNQSQRLYAAKNDTRWIESA